MSLVQVGWDTSEELPTCQWLVPNCNTCVIICDIRCLSNNKSRFYRGLHGLLSKFFRTKTNATRVMSIMSDAESYSHMNDLKSTVIASPAPMTMKKRGAVVIRENSTGCIAVEELIGGGTTTNRKQRSTTSGSEIKFDNLSSIDLFIMGCNTVSWDSILSIIHRFSSFDMERMAAVWHVLTSVKHYDVCNIRHAMGLALRQISTHQITLTL